MNETNETLEIESRVLSDDELSEVSGASFRPGNWVTIFEGQTTKASTLGALEKACTDLGAEFVVYGGDGSYDFSCRGPGR